MIEMKGINKTYRVRQREAGLGNAVKHLFSRDYTEIPALRDMTFTIPDGQIVGYIGPNGAGKTTTLNMLTGYLAPSEGSIKINARQRHLYRQRPHPLGGPEKARFPAGRGLRPAQSAVVGCAGERVLFAAAGYL